MRFAIYASRELRAVYYNGAGYVVRHDMYPHTTLTDGSTVTRQGHQIQVGIRQGLRYGGPGFATRRYMLPDTAPSWSAP